MKNQGTASLFHSLRWLGVLVLGAVLSACGGGGGGTTASSAPTLSLTPQSIKIFHFSWTDVAGETEYRLQENPDGSAGYTQVATITADTTSYDLQVSLPARINARYILQACNSGGCSDSAPVYVSGTLAAAVGYVKASNSDAGDTFGWSVALSGDGNTLAVGAFQEASNATGIGGDQTDNSAIESGAVYVFTRSGAGWSQQAYLKASNAGANDYFGYSVALSADGNTLAVGARGEASNATGIGGDQTDNSAIESGAVYVFTRSGGITWSQQAYVKASNAEANDKFGYSVALAADGNTLAVGATNEASNATGINGDEANNSPAWSGAVYVFTRSGGITWSQQAYVKASYNGGYDTLFGSSVALAADGSTLAVGARFESSNATGINGDQTDTSALFSGAVYVFTRSGATWSQQAYVKASNRARLFGTSAALAADGNTLGVGASGEESNATGIDGDQADNSATESGAVYVFTRSGATWSQQAYVKASNTETYDFFGTSLALTGDGNTLAVGAPGEDSNSTGIDGEESNNSAGVSGAVYVFTRSGATWSQQAYVKASNAEANDKFGYSVALAADGNTLAVGATQESSDAIGIGGDQTDNSATDSGAVYFY